MEYSFDKDNDHLITTTLYWDYNINDWYAYNKEFYYYNSLTTGIQNIKVDNIVMYPNPTSGIINLTGLKQQAEVKLYSIQGKQLKTFKQVQSSLDISDLPAGLYLLKIYSGNIQKTDRIIKK